MFVCLIEFYYMFEQRKDCVKESLSYCLLVFCMFAYLYLYESTSLFMGVRKCVFVCECEGFV